MRVGQPLVAGRASKRAGRRSRSGGRGPAAREARRAAERAVVSSALASAVVTPGRKLLSLAQARSLISSSSRSRPAAGGLARRPTGLLSGQVRAH